MQYDILQILQQLIKFKSVTPKGSDAIHYVSKILLQLGFKCEIKNFGKGEEQVTNLYAVYGKKKPNICFAGHLDVVPAIQEESWKYPPYRMTLEGNLVYGRGAVDMKGAVACSIAAVSNYVRKQNTIKGSISFLLTTDEEGIARYGTKAMLEYISNSNKYKPIDFCILGEPTTKQNIGDIIKIGRRGSINFKLKLSGVQGHVAYPEKL